MPDLRNIETIQCKVKIRSQEGGYACSALMLGDRSEFDFVAWFADKFGEPSKIKGSNPHDQDFEDIFRITVEKLW